MIRLEVRRSVWPYASALALSLLAVLLIGAAASDGGQAAPVVASGFADGPLLTDEGLAWDGLAGVELTRANETTSVLAQTDAPNWDNFVDQAWFGSRWWAIAGTGSVRGGPIGGPLKPVSALSSCNPGSKAVVLDGISAAAFEISGEDLVAALPPSCAPRGHRRRWTLVRIDLRTGRLHVIAGLSAKAVSVAVAGRYVAVALRRRVPIGSRPEFREFVRVLNALTGRLMRQIEPPPEFRESGGTIQLDTAGDVLAGCCLRTGRELAWVAGPPRSIEPYWWAPAGAKEGTAIQLGARAVLSDGRIAYLAEEGEAIDIRDMHNGTTLTAVTFAGTASPGGLAFSGETLAWEQQSFGTLTPPNACIPTPLTAPQLMSTELSTLSRGPLVVVGPEGPPLEHPCVSPEPGP